MKLGDTVENHKMFAYSKGHKLEAFKGTCVYIHPDRRFFTLRYDLPGGTIHEDFPFQYRKGENA